MPPASSERQRRFFGAVIGAKKGTVKHPSKALSKAAHSISLKKAKEFASSVKSEKGFYHHMDVTQAANAHGSMPKTCG